MTIRSATKVMTVPNEETYSNKLQLLQYPCSHMIKIQVWAACPHLQFQGVLQFPPPACLTTSGLFLPSATLCSVPQLIFSCASWPKEQKWREIGRGNWKQSFTLLRLSVGWDQAQNVWDWGGSLPNNQ